MVGRGIRLGGFRADQRNEARHSRHTFQTARPTMVAIGTAPNTRLSSESLRLSPMTQTWPADTVTGPNDEVKVPLGSYGSSSRSPST